MAIRDVDTVDLVLRDRADGAWILVVAEPGAVPDTPGVLDALAAKLAGYEFYVDSGALVSDHPEAAGAPVRFRLAFGEGELGPRVRDLLRDVGGRLASKNIEVYAERVPPAAAADAPADPFPDEVLTLDPADAEHAAERDFLTARLTGDPGDAVWVLTLMAVTVPMREGGAEHVVVSGGGRDHVVVYTSRRTLLATMRGGYDTVAVVPFADLVGGWPHRDVGIVVNPGTNSQTALDATVLAELTGA